MVEILTKLAAFPAKVGIDTAAMPHAVGCSLTWEQRSELLSLAALAKEYADDDDDSDDDDDDDDDLRAGDEVELEKETVATNGRVVPAGATGTVVFANEFVRVDFPEGPVVLDAAEAEDMLVFIGG